MMPLYVAVCFGILVLALIWVSGKSGEHKANKKQAEKEKEHAEKVSKIGSTTEYVDDPAERL